MYRFFRRTVHKGKMITFNTLEDVQKNIRNMDQDHNFHYVYNYVYVVHVAVIPGEKML